MYRLRRKKNSAEGDAPPKGNRERHTRAPQREGKAKKKERGVYKSCVSIENIFLLEKRWETREEGEGAEWVAAPCAWKRRERERKREKEVDVVVIDSHRPVALPG